MAKDKKKDAEANAPKRTAEAAEVALGDIRAAAWNVHVEPSADGALDGLAASMARTGLVQRIAVRRLADGSGYEIVDGHRRVAAAKRLGWETIPADVLSVADDCEAKLALATANVQRAANDPLLEAELIGSLRDAGLSFERIGAAIGRHEAYVARRARLASLTDKWRGFFRDKGADASDAALMEEVARHEPELQDEVFEGYAVGTRGFDLKADAKEVREWFESEMRSLDPDAAPFDVAGCANCDCNTKAQGCLFPDYEDGFGRCQDAACFAKMWNAATDAEIARLRGKGVEVKAAKSRWEVPLYWSATPKRERKNVVPWVYEDDDLKRLVWTEEAEKKAAAAEPAKTEAELAEERRVKAAHKEWARLRRSGFDKARKALLGRDAAETAAQVVASPRFAEEMRRRYGRVLAGYVSDEELTSVLRVLGADALGVGADELAAIEEDDPAVVAGREAVSKALKAAEEEGGEA